MSVLSIKSSSFVKIRGSKKRKPPKIIKLVMLPIRVEQALSRKETMETTNEKPELRFVLNC